jgi:hypothetical protein
MNTRKMLAIALVVASTQVLGACASLAQLQSGDGFIADVGTQQVRLCFRSGVSPSPGQEVRFVANANTPRASYKSMWPEGKARISAVGNDGCATAIVLNGRPHREDDVHLLSSAQRDNGSSRE